MVDESTDSDFIEYVEVWDLFYSINFLLMQLHPMVIEI